MQIATYHKHTCNILIFDLNPVKVIIIFNRHIILTLKIPDRIFKNINVMVIL